MHNRIHVQTLKNRGAPEEAITAALAVTGSAMQDRRRADCLGFTGCSGLEQPYGASPNYDNPKKGPLSMTGGWERANAAGNG